MTAASPAHALLFLGLLFGAALVGPERADATVLVNSKGFEAPQYSPGPLESMNGWIRQSGGGGGSALVQSSQAVSGAQTLKVTRGSNSDDRWAVPVTSHSTEPSVTIDWTMRVDQSVNSTSFGPFFGVETYDDSVALLRSAMLGVDASTGEVLYGDRAMGLTPAPGNPVVAFGSWNQFRIVLNFTNDTYQGFLNGASLFTTSFEFTGVDRFTDADIAAIAAGGDFGSQSLTGVAYFDNFIVRDGLRGDFNNDRKVDAADYTVWRDSNNQSGFGLAADGDGNGVVNGLDYQIWRQDYGRSNAANLSTAVPEPLALSLLAPTMGVVATRRRRGQ